MNYKEYVSIDIDINVLDDCYVQEMSQRVMFLALTESTALQRKWTARQAITMQRNKYMLLRNGVVWESGRASHRKYALTWKRKGKLLPG